MEAPIVVNTTATTLTLIWSPPTRPNGALVYRVFVFDAAHAETGTLKARMRSCDISVAHASDFVLHSSSDVALVPYEITNLTPGTLYAVHVEARTSAGAVNSSVVHASTLSVDLPRNFSAPLVTIVNET